MEDIRSLIVVTLRSPKFPKNAPLQNSAPRHRLSRLHHEEVGNQLALQEVDVGGFVLRILFVLVGFFWEISCGIFFMDLIYIFFMHDFSTFVKFVINPTGARNQSSKQPCSTSNGYHFAQVKAGRVFFVFRTVFVAFVCFLALRYLKRYYTI